MLLVSPLDDVKHKLVSKIFYRKSLINYSSNFILPTSTHWWRPCLVFTCIRSRKSNKHEFIIWNFRQLLKYYFYFDKKTIYVTRILPEMMKTRRRFVKITFEVHDVSAWKANIYFQIALFSLFVNRFISPFVLCAENDTIQRKYHIQHRNIKYTYFPEKATHKYTHTLPYASTYLMILVRL